MILLELVRLLCQTISWNVWTGFIKKKQDFGEQCLQKSKKFLKNQKIFKFASKKAKLEYFKKADCSSYQI